MSFYIQRKSDGQLLRGAWFWQWTKFKKLACKLTKSQFEERLAGGYLEKFGIKCEADVDFIK